MKIVNRKVSELIHAEYNPRQLTEDQHQQLKDSLARFGFVDPVIVNKHSERLDIIVGGHQRCKVWSGMGNSEVPTVEVDLTPDKEKELNIRLNKNSGEWNYDMLANHFDTEELMEWGFKEQELGFMESEPEEDGYELPDPETIETNIKEGDCMQIGEHYLYCGSSIDVKNWSILMQGKKADLVVTDPPYNVDYQGNNGHKIINDKQTNEDFYEFLLNFYIALGEYTKPGGAWYVWHADSEGYNFRRAFIESGLLMKQCLIWVKNSLVMGRQDYQWKHEPCLYGWKEGAAHYFTGERNHTTVIEDEIDYEKLKKNELLAIIKELKERDTDTTLLYCDKPTKNDLHPTMKPILLLAPLIENSSKPGEIICDGFLGSGSTMVACEQLNRKCYGMEIDPKYCQVIVDRMAKLNPELTIKINGEVSLR